MAAATASQLSAIDSPFRLVPFFSLCSTASTILFEIEGATLGKNAFIKASADHISTAQIANRAGLRLRYETWPQPAYYKEGVKSRKAWDNARTHARSHTCTYTRHTLHKYFYVHQTRMAENSKDYQRRRQRTISHFFYSRAHTHKPQQAAM